MKIIILGAGQVGRSMADILSKDANDITLVDRRREVLDNLQNRLDIRTLCGPASSPSVLERAGAEDADLLLAVTDSDEVNMVACQVAHSMFRTPKKIARIREQDYLQHTDLFNDAAVPIDVIISPEQIVTEQITRLIEYPGALQVIDFAAGRIRLAGVKAYTGGALVGHELRELKNHLPAVKSRVAALYRNEQAIIPSGDTIIEAGDEVFFIATQEHIRKVMQELRSLDEVGKKVMIAGAGNIGLQLARALERRRYQVKLFERDEKRAALVAEQLENTVVIMRDAADETLLREENIQDMELFCALTNKDEANILSAMLAKRLGVRRSIAIINRSDYVGLIQSNVIDIDIAISPSQSTVSALLRHLRRGDVVAAHSLRRGLAEAIEAVAHGDQHTSNIVGRRLAEIKLPQGTTIGAILRQQDLLDINGQTCIEDGDHLLLFVTDKRRIREVEKLFQVAATFF